MLAKKHRLTGEDDYGKVFQQGRSFQDDFLVIRVFNSHLPLSRFGFIVSNKISKKATRRNLIKRRLREAARRILDQIKPGYDVVIMAKPEIRGQDFREMSKMLEELLRQAGLI